MKALVAFSIIALILLSGCAEQPVGKEPSPDLATSTQPTTQEAEITESTTVQIIKSEPSGPKTYQVNVVEGIGIKEGSG